MTIPYALRRATLAVTVCWLLAAGGQRSQAKNIDLSTVPDRETVQLTIYNSEDLTLVRETRKVSFKPGANPLQFSWANTLIDPTSVELKFLTDADKLVVLDTTFPHDKPQMLYWNVKSEIDGEATIEITYFTSGISWSADYVCISDTDETAMSMESYVRVTNNSGEEYEDAQVRLVVGQVNLVEKIAKLAQISMQEVAQLGKEVHTRFRADALRGAIARDGKSLESKSETSKPKEIIKEGLSEYFIYTIEGTETIPNGWAKRMRSFEAEKVPFRIQYRYRVPEYGDRLVRMYLLKNDKDSALGTTPLPDGVVRVFRDNGRDGLSFLVAQPIKYVPIGDKIELNLGVDPEVVFQLVKLRVWLDRLWLKINGTDVYKRADKPGFEIDVRSSVAGWGDHALFAQRIRNYSRKPIEVEVRRTFPGHILFRGSLKAKNHDYRTVEYTAKVKAGQKVELLYEIVRFHGWLEKQSNVTIEEVEIDR